MRTIKRGLRALMRSPLRAGLLVGVLGVSVGLTLIMITVNGAFARQIDDIKGQVGTDITVRPAGSFGGGFSIVAPDGGDSGPQGNIVSPDTSGGDSAAQDQPSLSEDDIARIASVEHVAGISSRITAQYTGDELESGFTPPEGAPSGFSPPILITGTDSTTDLTTLGSSDATITAGRTFNADEGDANVAVVGQSVADKNSLAVGDTFTIQGEEVEVVGIYSTGTQFGDNSIFMPLKTTQRLFDRGGEVDEVTVQADSVNNVGAVADSIRTTLGTDVADVSTQEGIFDAIAAPISDAKDSSRVGMIAALIASAAVIVFSVGLVARQRVREIGILKAIGASRWQVISQFGIETVVVSVVAALVGAAATFPLAQSVADTLVSDSSTPGAVTFGPGGGPPGGGVFIGSAGDAVQTIAGPGGASGFLGDVDVAVSPEIFGYALLIAIGLALLATIIPAAYVGRVRPAEVLRNE